MWPFKHLSKPVKSEESGGEQWVSWKLRGTMIYPVSVVTAFLIAGVTTIMALSNARHGFNITNNSDTRGHIWKLSLVWVVIPTFIFITYGLCMGTIVDAFIFRQPFIELVRGAPLQKSIALDYQTYFPLQREYKMVRNGHFHLAGPSLLSLGLRGVIGALSARLLVEGSYTGSEPVSLKQTHAFLASTSIGESLSWDLVPVFGVTSATKVYGGSYPRWSNGDRTFLNFTHSLDREEMLSQPRLTGYTPAYFALLDCQIMQDVQQHLSIYPDAGGNSGRAGQYYLNGTDNGCDWTLIFSVTSEFQRYMRTSNNVSCGAYGDSSFSGRLIIMSGEIASLDDSNITVVSCVPTYWTSMNRLTMNLDTNALNSIVSFDEDETTRKELRPQWWNSFESQLQQVQSVDTTVSGGLSGVSTTTMGQIILDKLQRDSADPLDADALIEAARDVYATTYAILVDTFMIRPAPNVTEFNGELSTTHDRLFVVNAIAGIILGFLLSSAIALAVVFFYTHNPKHEPGLFEEPIGILGYAAVSHGGVVDDLLEDAKKAQQYRGKAATDVKKSLKVNRPNPPADRTKSYRRRTLGAIRRMHVVRKRDQGTPIFRMKNHDDPRAACIVMSRPTSTKERAEESFQDDTDVRQVEALRVPEVMDGGVEGEEDSISAMSTSSWNAGASADIHDSAEQQHKTPVVTAINSP